MNGASVPQERTPMYGRRVCIAVIAVTISLSAVGCAPKPYALRYEPAGAPLTGMEAETLAASTDISALTKTTTADAPALRSIVLEDLRARDETGARAADLLTEGFPAQTEAVPVLVRISSVDGTAAVVVVEAFGDDDGTLTHRRLWVFVRETGAILRAASFR
jgi:hypothetical protein